MKTMIRRIGVASVAAAIVAGAFSTSQAGVIPWLYDSIFGPAYYSPYYGASASSYHVGYSPCGPAGCRTGCGPCASPCSTGKCSPQVSFCNPCEVAATKCEPGTNWKSGEEPARANVKTKVLTEGYPNDAKPDYRDDRTFKNKDNDGDQLLKKQPIEAGPAVPVEPAKPGFSKTPGSSDDTGFGNQPGGGTDASDLFPPKKGDDASAARPLNLEAKSTWSVTGTRLQRSNIKATFRDASIARRTIDVPAAAATSSGNAVVKK